jgi:hypothetical protein
MAMHSASISEDSITRSYGCLASERDCWLELKKADFPGSLTIPEIKDLGATMVLLHIK